MSRIHSLRHSLLIRADVIGHEPEVAVGWHERQDALGLPTFETYTRMKAHIVQQTWINKRQRQVGHSGQFNTAVDLKGGHKSIHTASAYISLNLCENSRSILVDNRVDFLDNVEICLIIRVLYACTTPWNVRELSCGQLFGDAARDELQIITLLFSLRPPCDGVRNASVPFRRFNELL